MLAPPCQLSLGGVDTALEHRMRSAGGLVASSEGVPHASVFRGQPPHSELLCWCPRLGCVMLVFSNSSDECRAEEDVEEVGVVEVVGEGLEAAPSETL